MAKEKIKFILVTIVLFVVLLAGIILFYKMEAGKKNGYLIKNSYYGFELQLPKGWIAEAKTLYSEDNIARILQNCKNSSSDQTNSYEVGRFKFKSHNYPQNFDQSLYASLSLPSGVILDVVVNCVPFFVKNEEINYGGGDVEIGGEKTVVAFSDLPGVGKIKYFSFLHDGLQYVISEHIYISSQDEQRRGKAIKADYEKHLDEIVSTFEFVK